MRRPLLALVAIGLLPRVARAGGTLRIDSDTTGRTSGS